MIERARMCVKERKREAKSGVSVYKKNMTVVQRRVERDDGDGGGGNEKR